MSKKFTTTTACILGLVTSPITWAGFFPEAGVDKAPSLAQFVVTFTDRGFIRNHPELGLCHDDNNIICTNKDRTITSPILYEAQTKVGRSRPHFHNDSVDVEEGSSVCKEGMWDICFGFYTDLFIKDSDFVLPWYQGPAGTEEVHTRLLSMNLTPLKSSRYNPSQMWNSANRIRGGSAAPDQLPSIGEVESLDVPGGLGGFPAESFFNMNVEVDMDMDFDGNVDLTLVTGNLPLLVTGTGLTKFPPKLVYVHNATKLPTPMYDKADTSSQPEAVAYLRMAGHGMSYGTAFSQTRSGKNTRDSQDAEDPEVEEFLAIFHSQPLLPMPPSGDPPVCQLYAIQDHGLNNSQIYTISPETFDVEPISVRFPKHDLEGLDTHPINDKLYLTSGNDSNKPGYLYSFDVQTAELTEIGDTGFGDVPSIAFSSDSVLWGWAKDKGLITIDIQSGQGTMVKEFPGVSIEDITWNNEGTHIYASEDTNLWVYEYATQTATLACNNLPGETEGLEMLPDGTLLLGIHGNKKVVKFKAFNVETCDITFDIDIPTSPTVNDVEGIAWPINACSN